MNSRQKWLALALLATLAAVFWPQQQDSLEGVVESVRRPQAAASQATAPAAGKPSAEATVAGGARLAEMQKDLFPRQTWVPPPPPPPKPPPPPPPRPPALPFAYVGSWAENGSEVVFLSQGGRTFAAKVGQVLPGAWRLDEITRGGVVFTYLPLDMQSTLGITP